MPGVAPAAITSGHPWKCSGGRWGTPLALPLAFFSSRKSPMRTLPRARAKTLPGGKGVVRTLRNGRQRKSIKSTNRANCRN